jgi:hypothetical protein
MNYREKCLSQKINTCYACGTADEKLVVHHIDGDEHNDDLDNLVPMCKPCHGKLHTSKSLNGTLKRLQEKLPASALSYTDIPSNRETGRKATAVIPLTPETKRLLEESKPDGVTYDRWVRKQLGAVDD